MKISKYTKMFFILTCFQIVWIFCIFGEYNNNSYLGFLVGIFYIFFYFLIKKRKYEAFKICFIFSIFGYFFDSLLSYSNLFVVKSNIIIGYLPIWFIILWPSFCTLLVDIFVFLRNRPILAFLIGSIIVPPTYFSGIILNIAFSNSMFLVFIIMMIFWGTFMTMYSIYLKKVNPIL